MKKKWCAGVIGMVLALVLTAGAVASDSLKLVVNGQEIKPDVPAQIIKDRTMVPVRWIAEALGADVIWDEENRSVVISSNDSAAAQVVLLTDKFGRSLKNISLMAPQDIVKESLQKTYGELAAPALLTEWQNDPQNAPGRVSSSPWPERIDIIKLEKLTDQKYEVKGEIIEMTSVEMVNGGYAAKQPVTLVVENLDNRWLITDMKAEASQEAEAAIYKNSQYGFSFSLPDSWQGYSVITEEWEGLAVGSGEITASGPLLLIRHPQWTETNVRQDIPVMVFTTGQWLALQQGDFHIGAAPIGPRAMGRNNQYVFALPARYNFAFPTGYEEVEKILENVPLKPFAI